MVMLRESSRIFENTARSGPAEGQEIQEAPAGHGEQPRQGPMQRRQRARMAPNEMRDHRYGGKDPLAAHQHEAGAFSHPAVLEDRTVAGMLDLGCGADQTAAKQELHPRLQVREV